MRAALLLLLGATAWGQSPEQRAIAYLESEVRIWSGDNGCFSCHNNGDGARALYTAIADGKSVQPEALAETNAWLQKPAGWDQNHGDPGFSDQSLAHVQWAASLAASKLSGLQEAAAILVDTQNDDGSWAGETAGSVGSPATWGGALATAMALRALSAASADRFAESIAAGERWLSAVEPKNLPEAAALVFAFGGGEAADKGRAFILDAQASDGGWGPYRNAPSEVFDTALATLALDDAALNAQGRQYLLEKQLSAGGWLETTRPSGSQSYAQHISTTAWALLALLKTDGE